MSGPRAAGVREAMDVEGEPPASRAGMRGTLAVTWLGHSTALIELDGARLLTDPVLGRRVGPLVRVAPPPPAAASEDIDLVLLSHLHADHADARSLRRLGAVRIVAPAGSRRWLDARGLRDVDELAAGESAELAGVTVTATHARHGSDRWRARGRAHAIGFVVSGTRSCYFAGDTDLFPAMAQMAGGIDVALLPIGGWGPTVGAGHLDPERAVQAAELIAPRVVVPIHWGTLALGWPRRRRGDLGEPARRFAELAGERLRDVQVRVLAPGERIEVEPAPPSTAQRGAQP